MLGRARHFLLAIIFAIFAMFLLWPVARVVRVAFFGIATDADGGHFTLGYVADVFLDPQLRAGLLNSAQIAVMVTLTCIVIAVPLAWLSVRYEFFGKSWVNALVLVPLILPPFVGAIGMRQILGRFGMLTSIAQHLGLVEPGTPVDWFGGRTRLLGIVLVESLSLYPIIFLNVSAALANLDPSMEQAAANLGASRWRIMRRITLPLMRPGLLAGSVIVMIWSFTELGTPLMLDYYLVTPVQIFHRLTQINGNPVPYALVVVMLVASIVLYGLGKLAIGHTRDAAASKATIRAVTTRISLVRSIAVLIPFVIVIGLAMLPHTAVILMSVAGVGTWYDSVLPRVFTGAHFATALTHDATVPSVANSVMFASLSTLVDLALGIAIAYMIVRASPRFGRLLDALSMLPLAVPGLVLAFGYLAISLQLQGWIGMYDRAHGTDHTRLRNFVDVTENPTALLVVAYAMRRLPYVVRSAVAGLQQTPLDLELAARNLGASAWRTLRRITVPLISANLIAGALLAFSFAMLEVS
ncbi:MAG: ABC transporter permease, partial [Tepidisphaeraceae bacterium]